MASEYIYRHILRLPPNQIITTRELLPYGRRSAVDQTLYRMVKSGFLTRLAAGVFVRDASGNPTVEEIVIAKMTAWGKRTFKFGEKQLMELQLIPTSEDFDSTFAMNAHSSSFNTVEGRAYLKGIGPRKVRLCETKVGQVVYALWHKSISYCEQIDVAIATRFFNRSERRQLRQAASMMPMWLSNLCYFRFGEARVS